MTFEEWLEFYSPGTAFTEGEKAPLHAAWLAGAAQRPEVAAIVQVLPLQPQPATVTTCTPHPLVERLMELPRYGIYTDVEDGYDPYWRAEPESDGDWVKWEDVKRHLPQGDRS